MSSTLIMVAAGYSQIKSSATAATDPTLPAPGSEYQISGANIDMLGIDGGFRLAKEPLWDPTREASGGSIHHNLDTPALTSAMGICLDTIRAGGESRTLLIVPCAKDSIQTAQLNLPTGGFTNDWTTVSNIMCKRIKQSMRYPNPVLGGMFVSTALGDAAAEASSPFVQAALNNWCNNVNTFVASLGLTWAKTHHFWFGRLQTPGPAAYNGGNMSAINSAFDALAAARSDTLLVQEPSSAIGGVVQQHITYAARQTWGAAFGASWLAAS